MHLYADGLVFFILALLAVLGGKRWLNNLAYKEVMNAPKIPMSSCDKHGLIPTDAMLKTTATALGRPDLIVEHCPICFAERESAAKKVLTK